MVFRFGLRDTVRHLLQPDAARSVGASSQTAMRGRAPSEAALDSSSLSVGPQTASTQTASAQPLGSYKTGWSLLRLHLAHHTVYGDAKEGR